MLHIPVAIYLDFAIALTRQGARLAAVPASTTIRHRQDA
jgi:hypothetical protein